MKLATMGVDLGALALVVTSASNFLPSLVAVIAGALGAVYYGLVIYDRFKYGPDLEGRILRKKVTTIETVQTHKPEGDR